MDVLNRETLIFVGIALLLINIIIGALLKRRFRAFSAFVATIAFIMVITGIVQVTLSPAAAQSNTGNFRGFGGNGNAGGGNGFGANGAASGNGSFTGGNGGGNTSADANSTPAANTGGNANGRRGGTNGGGGFGGGGNGSGRQLPPAIQTSIAEGTIPAPLQTRTAQAAQGGTGNNGGSNQGAAPAGTPDANTNGGGGFGGGGGGNGSGRQIPPAVQTSIAQGTVPAPFQTRIAARTAAAAAAGGGASANTTPQGTQPADGAAANPADQSGGANGGGFGGGGNFGQGGGFGSGGAGNAAAANTSPLTTLVPLARRFVPFLTIAGGLLVLFAGMLYYASERQLATFRKLGSVGLLYILIGAIIVVTMIGLPMAVTQAAGNSRVAAQAVTPTNGPAPTRANIASATPTVTPPPSDTPTPLPSLTPTVTDTPVVLSTPVQYTSGQATDTVTNCSVSALQGINLRAEPKTTQMAIGKVLAGSLMKVTGKSADGQWWRVISPDNVEGWVSAGYVTTYSGCTADSVPVIATATATAKP